MQRLSNKKRQIDVEGTLGSVPTINLLLPSVFFALLCVLKIIIELHEKDRHSKRLVGAFLLNILRLVEGRCNMNSWGYLASCVIQFLKILEDSWPEDVQPSKITYTNKPLGPWNFCPPFPHLLSERLTSLGIIWAPRVPPLNPSETIAFWEHYRLWGV